LYKESENSKRSSFLIKTVIPTTYETHGNSPLVSTILTIVDQKGDYSQQGEG